jgi:hypothetical protein
MHRVFTASLLAAALTALPMPARANQDAVQLFSNIHVTADQPVHDAVCFFCSVHVDGKVTGDIVVFFGSVHLAGEAEHDVVSFFGGVHAEDNASIGQDLVSFFGGVHLGENVTVGKDMVSVFGGVHAPASTIVRGDRVWLPAWIFWAPVLVVVLAILLVIAEVRNRRRRWVMGGYPMPPQP